ncbi:MAG TPA: hypothetical protein VKU94_05445 [Geobacterales bacterium]|nr:hypothetical protein [Geobacterales bacterium]
MRLGAVAGILITAGIILILISGIFDILYFYFDKFISGEDVFVEFLYKVAFNFLFWLGAIISVIGFYIKPKSLFLVDRTEDFLFKKYGNERPRFFKFFNSYIIIKTVIFAFTVVMTVLFFIEFLIFISATYGGESAINSLRSLSILFQTLPAHVMLIIVLSLVLINGALNNLPWIFEAVLYRKYDKTYSIALFLLVSLLYSAWILVVIIFVYFSNAYNVFNLGNSYMQSFDSSLISAIQFNVIEYLMSLKDVLQYIFYYLIVWAVLGVVFYFVYRFRPEEVRNF